MAKKTQTNGNDPVGTFPTEMHPGLTKLEWMSSLIMAASIGNNSTDLGDTAKLAVEGAAALIEELNK